MIELAIIAIIIAAMITVGGLAISGRMGERKWCPVCQGETGYFTGEPDPSLCERHYKMAYRNFMLAGDGD